MLSIALVRTLIMLLLRLISCSPGLHFLFHVCPFRAVLQGATAGTVRAGASYSLRAGSPLLGCLLGHSQSFLKECPRFLTEDGKNIVPGRVGTEAKAT